MDCLHCLDVIRSRWAVIVRVKNDRNVDPSFSKKDPQGRARSDPLLISGVPYSPAPLNAETSTSTAAMTWLGKRLSAPDRGYRTCTLPNSNSSSPLALSKLRNIHQLYVERIYDTKVYRKVKRQVGDAANTFGLVQISRTRAHVMSCLAVTIASRLDA